MKKITKLLSFMLIAFLSGINITYAFGIDNPKKKTNSFYEAYQSNWRNVANFNANTNSVTMFSSPTDVSCNNNGTLDLATDDFITFRMNPTPPVAIYETPFRFDVTATQGGSSVAVELSNGDPATGLRYEFDRAFNEIGRAHV